MQIANILVYYGAIHVSLYRLTARVYCCGYDLSRDISQDPNEVDSYFSDIKKGMEDMAHALETVGGHVYMHE